MAKLKVDDDTYRIQGILFDKDGTLIELHSLWSSWFDEVWSEIKRRQPGLTCSKLMVAKSIGLDSDAQVISAKGPLAIGTMEDITIILAHHLYVNLLPWNSAVQTVRNSMQTIHETINWEAVLQPIDGLRDFLERASRTGVKMSVVTSDDTDIAIEHLKLLKLDHYFHSILGSEKIDFPKPYPELGIKACGEIDIDPKQVVVIGDTNSDMLLGKNIKAQASIGVMDDYNKNDGHLTDANHVIHHYRELIIT